MSEDVYEWFDPHERIARLEARCAAAERRASESYHAGWKAAIDPFMRMTADQVKDCLYKHAQNLSRLLVEDELKSFSREVDREVVRMERLPRKRKQMQEVMAQIADKVVVESSPPPNAREQPEAEARISVCILQPVRITMGFTTMPWASGGRFN